MYAEELGVYADIFLEKSSNQLRLYGNSYWEMCISLTSSFSDAVLMYNEEYELGMMFYIQKFIASQKQGG